MNTPIITLLTDFGLSGHYVAAMKGVILSICPQACIVDISHQIGRYQIPEAAYTLSQAWRCFPPGTIHVAVVDPGVGSRRRPILAEGAGHFFVGPGNGVFGMIGPGISARHITATQYFRHPVSRTFHGRDIFAPVAAHLALGEPRAKFGRRIAAPVPLAPPALISGSRWTGTILHIDHFGNVVTNFDWENFSWVAAEPFEMKLADTQVLQYCSTYADAPGLTPFLIQGSGGLLEVSLNQADAGKSIGAAAGGTVTLRKL